VPEAADHFLTSSRAITRPTKEAICLKAENNHNLLEQDRITRQVKAENHSNKKGWLRKYLVHYIKLPGKHVSSRRERSFSMVRYYAY
jgi:hypothetical protein